MRQLVTIKKIDKKFPIPKADRIEIVHIGGWSCIAKKDEFQVGDLCCYFEIDSFVPDTPTFEFLGKTTAHQGKIGHRVRTMKMREVVSQGLALPLSMFPELTSIKLSKRFEVGMDITEHLGVIKYDIDVAGKGPSVSGSPKGNFPSFIPKTNQDRIQNLPHYFDLYKDTMFEESYKLDGSSCTMYKTEKEPDTFLEKVMEWLRLDRTSPTTHFGVCSRNLELTPPQDGNTPSNFWYVADKYNINRDLPVGYAVQGEVIAPNIQANYEKVKDPEFHIFSVYDINDKKYLGPDEAQSFVAGYLPDAIYVRNTGIKLFEKCTTYEDLQDHVDTPSIYIDQKVSEGKVYKSMDGTVSFKVINNKYLLQKEK